MKPMRLLEQPGIWISFAGGSSSWDRYICQQSHTCSAIILFLAVFKIRPSKNGNFTQKKKKKILHSKIEILCSENTKFVLKTALNTLPRILHSENANFVLKNCSGALNRPPRNQRSENGNSVLKKWKFHTQKWKFCTQKMENFSNAMERCFFWQIGQFCTEAFKSILRAKIPWLQNREILERLYNVTCEAGRTVW